MPWGLCGRFSFPEAARGDRLKYDGFPKTKFALRGWITYQNWQGTHILSIFSIYTLLWDRMPSIPRGTHINFASALLLHSCVTVLLIEALNVLDVTSRLLTRRRKAHQEYRAPAKPYAIETSAVLDGYTSILSADTDGELAELYFTNTGFALLAVSLASSVAMNLLLPDIALNMIVAGTFVLAFVASLAVGHAKYTLPLMALRRAGRFIWSDTPFINFFSFIYIATVLKGQSTLRLQDYVTFRSIAVIELVFMKARLASAEFETQISLIRKLIASERILLHAVRSADSNYVQSLFLIKRHEQKSPPSSQDLPIISRNDIQVFRTSQRLSVMFCKTSVGHEHGCIAGTLGPVKLPLPAVGRAIEDSARGWKAFRFSEDVMVLADCFAESKPKDRWSRCMTYMHGILLRRLGKKRVVYLVRRSPGSNSEEIGWHSNVNLVTGVSMDWLDESFGSVPAEHYCVVAARAPASCAQ